MHGLRFEPRPPQKKKSIFAFKTEGLQHKEKLYGFQAVSW